MSKDPHFPPKNENLEKKGLSYTQRHNSQEYMFIPLSRFFTCFSQKSKLYEKTCSLIIQYCKKKLDIHNISMTMKMEKVERSKPQNL